MISEYLVRVEKSHVRGARRELYHLHLKADVIVCVTTGPCWSSLHVVMAHLLVLNSQLELEHLSPQALGVSCIALPCSLKHMVS